MSASKTGLSPRLRIGVRGGTPVDELVEVIDPPQTKKRLRQAKRPAVAAATQTRYRR